MKTSIRVAATDEEVLDTFRVMHQLRPHVRKSDYLRLVRLQQQKIGFQLAALIVDRAVTCVAGFRVCYSLGWGKYLYVDDLVTDEKRRSKGDGRKMFQWLVRQARKSGCQELRLDSATCRLGAHRFYLRERMDIACFHFRLSLGSNH